jgi:hypothetical protein
MVGLIAYFGASLFNPSLGILGQWIITTKKEKEKEKDGYISSIFHGISKLVNKPFFFSLGFSYNQKL